MARPKVSDYEISVKLADRQLEFLENKAEELGLSKEELVKLYIEKAIDTEQEENQFSLEGLCKGGTPITDEDIEEVINEWSKIESL